MKKQIMNMILSGLVLVACGDLNLESNTEPKDEKTLSSTPENKANQDISNTSSNSTSSDTGLENLVKNFQTLTESDIANTFKKLSQEDLLKLSLYPAFTGLVHLKACYADASLIVETTSGVENCQQQLLDWQKHMILTQQLFGNLNSAFEQVFREQGQLQVSLGCSSGNIDAASCSAYASGTAQINQMSHETSMAIINNIGGGENCLVSQDPNCTPF